MVDRPLAFFSPAAWPRDEAARQARVDEIDYARAAADPRLGEIVARAAALFGAASAAISIVDRHRQNWVVRFGLEEDGTARAISFCGHIVAAPGEAMTVPDATADRRFAGNPLVTHANVRFYAGAPLFYAGAALGSLCVVDPVAQPAVDPAAEEELARLAEEASAILSRYADPAGGRVRPCRA